MIDIIQFFDVAYLTVNPPMTIVYMWPIVAVLLVCVVGAVVLFVVKKRNKNPVTKRVVALISNWLFYPAILALLLIFCRNQGITLISWRLWLLVLGIVWMAGIIYIFYNLVFTLPQQRRQINVQKIKQKYMPGSKEIGR
ncbi:MAG TPA: hypothetical protein PLC05_01690 [bacterium]|nr:hypothetical protein [bacterium]HOR57200.1 hypothetical protein [bacterium]HPL56197.1 hypothetical protein [bacterium]